MKYEFVVYLASSGFNFPIQADNAQKAVKLAYTELSSRGIKTDDIYSLGYIEF